MLGDEPLVVSYMRGVGGILLCTHIFGCIWFFGGKLASPVNYGHEWSYWNGWTVNALTLDEVCPAFTIIIYCRTLQKLIEVRHPSILDIIHRFRCKEVRVKDPHAILSHSLDETDLMERLEFRIVQMQHN